MEVVYTGETLLFPQDKLSAISLNRQTKSWHNTPVSLLLPKYVSYELECVFKRLARIKPPYVVLLYGE